MGKVLLLLLHNIKLFSESYIHARIKKMYTNITIYELFKFLINEIQNTYLLLYLPYFEY